MPQKKDGRQCVPQSIFALTSSLRSVIILKRKLAAHAA